MKNFIVFLTFLIAANSYCQDSTSCKCSFSYTPKYPKKAEVNGICGEVVVVINRDEQGMFSNPVIKKGLGYGCDEEATRIMTIWVNAMNKCMEKCKPKKNKAEIITQKIAFICPEKDE